MKVAARKGSSSGLMGKLDETNPFSERGGDMVAKSIGLKKENVNRKNDEGLR